MKKIAVIGLGIIGGSICGALTKAGYEVHGNDLDNFSVAVALEKGYIVDVAEDLSRYERVILAVPPKAAIRLLCEEKFKDGALVGDICGVKACVEKAVYEKVRNYRYVGVHPMAGKETSGIGSASPTLFVGANLIITVCDNTEDSALLEMQELWQDMGVGRIVLCSASEHDKKIAITSQLAHIVSNAYVKSEQAADCEGFTGGSFQDMTRIAGVDEKIWTDLYFANKECVLMELDALISRLSAYSVALKENDEEKLSACLKEGRIKREKIKRPND
ncbi:MAG: prephenate dehydrogenase/arogenate dehydrogenase family protein [Clostridia bacterium]|nr:prephenate dehydrogenase/arogenate dehydrogenase family protein [Clostridia bacterium]